MTDYIDSDTLRSYIGSETANFQDLAATVCTVASRAVDAMCGRFFYADPLVSTAYYDPDSWFECQVDDIYTTTGLILATDDAADGIYATTWTLDSDYFLEPVNQTQGGILGYPYTAISSTTTRVFWKRSSVFRRPLVKVTAKFGWAAVPDDVTHATLIAAARLFKMKDAADGFVGLAGWGPVQIKQNPEVRALLSPYMKSPVVVA